MTTSNTALERDPVCGMNVNPATAKYIHELAGKNYYFCCAGCVEKFKANPQGYLAKPASTLVTLGMPGPAKISALPSQRDPVCGMTVNPATARHIHEHAGKKYYFCSSGCVKKFKANPQGYLAKPASTLVTLGMPPNPAPMTDGPRSEVRTPKSEVRHPAYVCPMCPEVHESKPGACPSCGMALEPDVPVAATRTEYTCPMHPQIVRSEPGSCPICGMALEPRTVTAAQEENPELRDMTRRFLVGVALTTPLLAIAMGSMLWPGFFVRRVDTLAGFRYQFFLWGWGIPWLEFFSPRRSSSGAASHSSSASGRRSSTAAPTCSR